MLRDQEFSQSSEQIQSGAGACAAGPEDSAQASQPEVLQAWKARYRLIEENIYDLIATFDPQSYEFLYISPSHTRLFGYEPQEVLKSNCFAYIHPADRSRVEELFVQGLKAGHGSAEYRVRKKDGAYIWVEANARLIEGLGGRQEVLLINRDITHRKQVEDALRASEEKYRLIVENVQDIISIVDGRKLRAVFTNPALERTLGYTWDEYRRLNILELVHPKDRKAVRDALETGLKQGEHTIRYRYRKKDGSYVWLETHGRVIDDGDRLLFNSRDVSAHMQAEQALREQEQKLKMITDNMLDGVIFVNQAQKLEYVSSSFFNILGFEPAQILGLNIDPDRIHPDDQYLVRDFMGNYAKQESIQLQCRARNAKGDYVWLEAVGNAVHHKDGLAGWVFGIRDISARKKAEEELQQQLDYHSYLMDNMHESFYTYDHDLCFTFINRRACDSLGYSPEELLGRCILDFIHEQDRETVRDKALKRLAEGGTGTYEHRALCKDGRELLLRIRVAPIYEGSQIVGGQVMAEDITQLRQMETEMVRLAQLQTVGEIAAGIGHEIRNPMTTVRGFLQMLAQSPELYEQRSYFRLMMEELDRANTIISEFLSLAKDKATDFAHHNLNRIIENIFPLLKADATVADKYIDLKLNQIPDLWVDEKEIRQLVINLVRNGLEAMEAGGTLFIQTRREGQEVILTIKDQGKGMAEEVKSKLGTPFFTTKENGTGLGLAVCYSIARRHEARIEVESDANGTVFVIRFNLPDSLWEC